MTDLEKLMEQMDAQQPRWVFEFARDSELRDMAEAEASQRSRVYRNARTAIALRLMMPVRAAVCAGLVAFVHEER